jgi:hypothetical protein
MTMQRDLRPLVSGRAAAVLILALALLSLFLTPLIHDQLQSSLRHAGFCRASGGVAASVLILELRALVVGREPIQG